MHVKILKLNVCISLEQNVQFDSFLGAHPCYVSGQVVSIVLLVVQIHMHFLELVDNW